MITKVLSLLTAGLYFIFSCMYVTRCPNVNHTSGYNNNAGFGAGLPKQNSTTLSQHKNTKSIPAAFLSRPRVIFSKNIAVSLKAPSISLFVGDVANLTYKARLKSKYLENGVVYPNKTLSVLRSWRI
ncbi:hypothetical protein ACFGVS_14845 [Mucilaginibacter sp. AW1-7]|uniref:hypothetical protein n=1 Tax=Mucilaginibacter sp. AW1-7 TaxID=3349874 RepID=UPI003F731A1A